MDEAVVLKKNPDIVSRCIDKEIILIPLYKSSDEANCIYTLNKVASIVWDLFDGKRTLGEVKQKVLKQFDATPKAVDKEMKNLIKDLQDIRAVVKRGGKCQKS